VENGHGRQQGRAQGDRHDQGAGAQCRLPGDRLGDPGAWRSRRYGRLRPGAGLCPCPCAAACRRPGRSASQCDRQDRARRAGIGHRNCKGGARLGRGFLTIPNDEMMPNHLLRCSGEFMISKPAADDNGRMKRKTYEKELRKLQVELCHLQDWVKEEGARIIILFEGRDAAGKGGTIKALTERVSPRVFRVVALPAPSDREKTQMFMQRYIERFPAAGEIVIFDRSWY